MAVVYVVLTVLAGYFLGCVNGALLVSKYILHDDVRDHGSGNAGLTNFHRVFGGKLTIVVVLCDMLKAVCAVLVGQLLMGHFLGLVVLGKYVAGLSCMLGHMFPCMFHFKGGKGILSGGAIALNGLAGVVLSEWMLVIYGMVFSLVGGFILGMVTTKIIEFLFSRVNRQRGNKVCMVLHDICACALSFLHGAQDGQKFMSIGLLGIALAFGMETSGTTDFPLWLMIICSAAMSLGTLLGGKRIIKSVAMDMVSLEKYQGVAASLSTVVTLFVASMTGMPVSTSHCSTASIMGVGASKSFRRVNWGVARRMVWAWVLTFPCCGFIGWALAKLFMML